ncbi:hypothetical protein YC2023_017003 [Brassica napus]
MEAGYNCSSNEQLHIWSKELTLIIYRCMHTNKHRNENEYIHFNFSDKTHTRSMRLKLMEPSLLSLVASITFKPQRQLLAQIASLILPLEAPQCIHCLSLTFTSFLQD